MRMLGIILIVIGVVSLIWGGVSYIKGRDTIDLGVAQVTTEDKGRISIPPVLGVISLVAGGVMVGMSSRKASS
ncbi:MAG TPA: hypothetical protein VFX92_11210 [Candidatus Krumholzibacteria bacterium]|nr:hypothetical protein [Candidatus Krumholzibacteria bacterium]